ncbi:MAG: VOC family protein [Myxococcota bacterium]|nr:VOC family protein [Myxococcota bacterium]
MGIHHVALATRDVEATHAFYTGPMGFKLSKVEVAKAGDAGFAKHLFYDTGGHGMIAFWDIHDPALPADWSAAISDGLGLPRWANHVAFTAHSAEELDGHLARWREHGLFCWEIDHGWCRSIYVNDPNDIMVEFCLTTREFTAADLSDAERLLHEPNPTVGDPPRVEAYPPEQKA